MRWLFIDSGKNSGKYNMDFDIFLSRHCTENQAYFRLYRWEPYAISLGANQSFEEINTEKANEDNIDVVKRPTGGRAILHAEELTYSIVLPVSFGLAAREVYNKTSVALSKGLGMYNDKLRSVELESHQPDFKNELDQPSGALCFASTAKSEVKFNNKKLIGSAQRKMNNIILQHGSILCGKYHTKLPYYLSDKSSVESLLDELQSKTTEISTITNQDINYSRLSDSILTAFEIEWDISFERDNNFIENEFEKSNLLINENA
ncbi:MAG: hypothetical protein GXO85_09400 [Chlorobi bacterium]|nr:hypothetical protein [Chlorobiota bacterium]